MILVKMLNAASSALACLESERKGKGINERSGEVAKAPSKDRPSMIVANQVVKNTEMVLPVFITCHVALMLSLTTEDRQRKTGWVSRYLILR